MSSTRGSSLEPQDNTNVKRKRKKVTGEELLDSDDSRDNVQTSGGPSDISEEPVLSHAERQRRKKQQKLAANLKEEEGYATKKRKLKDGSAKRWSYHKSMTR